ncbi:MAG: hypothetical protein GX215_05355 [Clostridiales Family XIII bacterium]|nr:hypothetical protein [Clostridiales Family XIII bacterium]NLW02959.1 hypothetical protein [Clostridiaceae bacterium]
MFGFDDRPPVKAKTDLAILQDGKGVYRNTIDENQTHKEIEAAISPDAKEITVRFEIIGEVKERIPMIIFADIKARLFQEENQ